MTMKKAYKTSLILAGFISFALSGCSNIPLVPNTNGSDAKKLVSDVSLDFEYLSLEIGMVQTLQATVSFKDGAEHDIDLKWVTSDPYIVTVEDGFVTAHSGGKASVSVIAGYKMASCSFNVTGGDEPVVPDPDEPVDPDNPEEVTLFLNPTSKNMTVGESFKITATVNPLDTLVSWSTSNEAIATVSDDGVVRAVGNGTAVITATAKDVVKQCMIYVGQEEEEEEEANKLVNFYIDYNNIDPQDKTGTKLLASFKWYKSKPLALAGDLLPADPADKVDSNGNPLPGVPFPYFIGWSSHTIIDSKEDLWDMEHDTIGYFSILNLYGIWSDVPKGEYTK